MNTPVLALVSVPPIERLLPPAADEPLKGSILTVPLLLSPPVTVSVPPGSAIPSVAAAVVSEIEPTVTGVVSDTAPDGMTASSPGPGTLPVVQSAAVFQLPASSSQVFVVIVPIPVAYRAPLNEARGRLECEAIPYRV